MRAFDHSSRSVLHLGAVTRDAAGVLSAALLMTVLMSAAASPLPSPEPPPLLRLALPPSEEETIAVSTYAADRASDGRTTGIDRMGFGEAAYAARIRRRAGNALRALEARSAFLSAMEEKARSIDAKSCFGGFVARAEDAASVVNVALIDRDGRVMSTGSGFVVADSGTPGSPRNKIVTARHVMNPADFFDPHPFLDRLGKAVGREKEHGNQAVVELLRRVRPDLDVVDVPVVVRDLAAPPTDSDPARIGRLSDMLRLPTIERVEIYAQDGTRLGRIRIVAMGAGGVGAPTEVGDPMKGSYHETPDDWAVAELDPSEATPEAIRSFSAIPGYRLASSMSPRKTMGMSGDPGHPAVGPGISGGPVMDASGRVHGIVSAALDNQDGMGIPGLVSPLELHDSDGDVERSRRTTTLAVRQPGIVNPLGDPRLLSALGAAGRHVKVTVHAPLYRGAPSGGPPLLFTALGMPRGVCVSSVMAQGPMREPMRDVRPKASPKAPAPLEVRLRRDGTVEEYDIDGLLWKTTATSGVVRAYEAGVLVSESRPGGGSLEYEGGRLVLLVRADGSRVAYENGRPTADAERKTVFGP